MSKRSKAVQEREEGPVEPESTPPPEASRTPVLPEVQETPVPSEPAPEPKPPAESNIIEIVDPVTGKKGRYNVRTPWIVRWS